MSKYQHIREMLTPSLMFCSSYVVPEHKQMIQTLIGRVNEKKITMPVSEFLELYKIKESSLSEKINEFVDFRIEGSDVTCAFISLLAYPVCDRIVAERRNSRYLLTFKLSKGFIKMITDPPSSKVIITNNAFESTELNP